MNVSISVLITYFNEGILLKECLDSLLNQTIQPAEILVYDDASDLPAQEFISPDYPVKVIRSEVNRGPAFGRNQLLELSQCEYVHFQDADDLFCPDWYEQVQMAILATQADIVITEVSSVTEGTFVSEKIICVEWLLDNTRDLIIFCLMNFILPASTTFRRKLALKIGGYRTREILPQSEDFDFHIRLAATGATYTAIPNPLIIQRLRSNSHSRNKKLCLTSALTATCLLSKELPSQYLPYLAEVSARIGSNLFSLNAYSEAREAFQVARQLGSPMFSHRKGIYQLIARLISQETAEQFGVWYRQTLPVSVRKIIGKQGL
ncbi:glycosyltransferase family 2 protein [Calothrix membranacea FACHB-236]|nr:glycosyltransferase family 2 protein [Calothrix membranacea FACHB-236]